MKITDVSTVIVNARLRNWIFVKITTDEPGLIGWGEATLEWKTHAVSGAIRDLTPLLVDQDPMRTAHLWQSMYRHPFFKGGVVTMSAISGVDQALWDIKGKALGVPVWQLIGSNVRDRVRMYDHLGGGEMASVYGPLDAEVFAERAAASVSAGFSAIKILAVPTSGPLPTMDDLTQAEQCMSMVRSAVGDGVEIMVDLHGRTTPSGALAYGHRLAPFRPWFFEEPCQPEDITALAEVARALPFPVASGERLIGRNEFRDLVDHRAAAIIQPDICHVGGITEMMKIASMADMRQIPLAPHNPLGPVAAWANLHVDFATPNFLIQEIMRADVPWRDEIVTATPNIINGWVDLPQRPGLGVDVIEKAAQRYPYQPETQFMTTLIDGSVGDW